MIQQAYPPRDRVSEFLLWCLVGLSTVMLLSLRSCMGDEPADQRSIPAAWTVET